MKKCKKKKDYPIKYRSMVKWLNTKYGKGWKYIHNFGWENKDGRTVWRVATGKDMDGEYTGESSLCMYFNDGTMPKWL